MRPQSPETTLAARREWVRRFTVLVLGGNSEEFHAYICWSAVYLKPKQFLSEVAVKNLCL